MVCVHFLLDIFSNGTGPSGWFSGRRWWKSVSVLINGLLCKDKTVSYRRVVGVGETSYMHNLGQCFLGALCGATPARSLQYLRVNVGASRGGVRPWPKQRAKVWWYDKYVIEGFSLFLFFIENPSRLVGGMIIGSCGRYSRGLKSEGPILG